MVLQLMMEAVPHGLPRIPVAYITVVTHVGGWLDVKMIKSAYFHAAA